MTVRDSASTSTVATRWAAQRDSILLTGRLLGVAITLVGVAIAFALLFVGVGVFVFPACVRALQFQAAGLAAAHANTSGIVLRVPELPRADGDRFVERALHSWRLLVSTEFWRLMRWAFVDVQTGVILAILPFGFVAWGVYGVFVMPMLYVTFRLRPTEWYAFIPLVSPAALPFAAMLGIGFIVFGFLSGPWWLRVQGRWSALLLGRDVVDLRERVDELASSRAEARRDAAAELRRIEQEVHDSTQSQLVAIGLKLGTAETLLEEDPQRARVLIEQAREDSSIALNELRDLMRGIRPPVLADRGLGPALEALALDATTTIATQVEVPERLDEAFETAVYFAARELITNAIKHANASRITLTAAVEDATLAVTISDDGRGGASIVPGHGLDGIRRRLRAFDGRLIVNSAVGGPTSMRIEAPCEL